MTTGHTSNQIKILAGTIGHLKLKTIQISSHQTNYRNGPDNCMVQKHRKTARLMKATNYSLITFTL